LQSEQKVHANGNETLQHEHALKLKKWFFGVSKDLFQKLKGYYAVDFDLFGYDRNI